MVKRRIIRHASAQSGFSLIEAMFATVILSFGIVSLMMLLGAGTKLNAYGNQLSTAVLLAEQARAVTDAVAFDDLAAYDGTSFNAVDVDGQAVPDLQAYQQSLTVTAVNIDGLSSYTGPDPPPAWLLAASVSCNGEQLTELTWLRTP